MNRSKIIIVTIGPSINEIQNIHHENYIYRINGAHSDPNGIKSSIEEIRGKIKGAKILVDLPGNKIRTQNLNSPIEVKNGEEFFLDSRNTNYPDFLSFLQLGDEVYADDSTLTFKVSGIDKGIIKFISYSYGFLKNNKGLHIRGIHDRIPFLFQKDKDIIEAINSLSIDFVGLSFVRDLDDIMIAKKLINDSINIISKIETKSAVNNLETILNEVKYILIDRGDLSSEVGLHKVPYYQDYIIEKSMFYSNKVFLATQFMKNMELNPIPSISEVIDLYNTFKSSVYGIQLSEETAIGKYPVECLRMVNTILEESIDKK